MKTSVPHTPASLPGMLLRWPLAAIVLLAAAAPAPATAFAALPLDADGWSILTPSSDTRLIYVSSVSGNDSTGAYYMSTDPLIGSDAFNPTGAIQPYATYAAAFAHAREGYPDWILFKRGETWTVSSGLDGPRDGRSDTERAVIASYGSSPTRPKIQTGFSNVFGLGAGGGRTLIQYIAVVGLHCYCDGHDPASPTFTGYKDGPNGIDIVGGATQPVRYILLEDCHWEWYGGGLDIQASAGYGHDLAVRRNVINNSWQQESHSQGMFCSGMYNVTLEENVFDHNGWYGFAGSGQGEATIFNHNTYFDEVHDVTFTGNTFLRSSSIQNKWVNYNGTKSYNITEDNNFYAEGEVGLSLIGNGAYGMANMTILNNVFEGIGRSRPTGRTLSFGMDIADWDGGLVQGNLFLRADAPAVNNTYAIDVVSGTGKTNRNITITGNTIYQLLSGGSMLELDDGATFSNISFTNNVVNTNTYTPHIAHSYGSLTAYSFSNNKYYTAAPPNAWFSVSGANRSFAQWQTLVGESGSTTGTLPYADPTRTVETYDAAQGGPGTFDDFIAQAKSQSKSNWRPAWMAAAVNTWIRAGFSTDHAPAFLADPFTKPPATAEAAYSGSIAADATDPDTSDTLTFSKRDGPGWLSVAANGALSGTPTNANTGLNQFTVRVTDQDGMSGEATMNVTVRRVTEKAVWIIR